MSHSSPPSGARRRAAARPPAVARAADGRRIRGCTPTSASGSGTASWPTATPGTRSRPASTYVYAALRTLSHARRRRARRGPRGGGAGRGAAVGDRHAPLRSAGGRPLGCPVPAALRSEPRRATAASGCARRRRRSSRCGGGRAVACSRSCRLAASRFRAAGFGGRGCCLERRFR